MKKPSSPTIPIACCCNATTTAPSDTARCPAPRLKFLLVGFGRISHPRWTCRPGHSTRASFFHGRTLATLLQVRWTFLLLCFAASAALALCAMWLGSAWPGFRAVLLQAPGLLAERWYFFVQAQHPQNLYYQVVSWALHRSVSRLRERGQVRARLGWEYPAHHKPQSPCCAANKQSSSARHRPARG